MIQELIKNIKEKDAPIVVGLDPMLSYVPEHIRKDAFDAIRSFSQCFILVGDFTDFFNNIEHQYLKKMICKVLDVECLPKDYFSVFLLFFPIYPFHKIHFIYPLVVI